MDESELFDKQYGKGKLVVENSYPRARAALARFDLNRVDLAISLMGGGKRLLDVGCGGGSLLLRAAEKYREVHGLDISEKQIELAETAALEVFGKAGNLSFQQCNVNTQLPFQENTFDTVTSIAVIGQIYDPYHIVSEMHRVLKRGGTLIVDVANIAYLKHRIYLLFGKLPVTSTRHNWDEIGWDGGQLHYFTKRTFCGLLENQGFEIQKVTGCGVFGKYRNFYPSLLTGDICVKAQKP